MPPSLRACKPPSLSYAQVMSLEVSSTPGLADLSFAETQQVLAEAGVRPVHAAALWNVLYRDGVVDELPGPLRRWLATQPDTARGESPVADRTISTDGRTEKFLLRLDDGQEIETVIMGYPGRFTACVSTQAGCAMGCVFCATGHMGLVRPLRPG